MANVNNAGLSLDLKIGGMDELQKMKDMLNTLKPFQNMSFNIGIHADNASLNQFGNTVNSTMNKAGNDVKQFTAEFDKSGIKIDGLKGHIDGLANPLGQFKSKTDDATSNLDFKLDKNNDSIGKLKGTINDLAMPIQNFKTKFNETTESVNHDTDGNISCMERFKETLGKLTSPVTSFANFFHRDSEKVKQDTDQTQSRLGRLRETFKGLGAVAGGNLIASGISNAASDGKTFVENAGNAAIGAQQTSSMWQSDVGQKQADAMTAELVDIRGKSDMAGASITAIQKAFLGLTQSAPKARELTNEVAAFGKENGLADTQIQNVTSQLTRMFSMSKVRPQMLNQVFKQMPKLKDELADASGLGQKKFAELAASGKMTGAQLEDYFGKASKYSSSAWNNYGHTFKGVMDSIKGTYQNVLGAFGKPMLAGFQKELMKVSESGKGLSKIKGNVLGIAKSIGTKVGNSLGKGVAFLVANRKSLSELTSGLINIIKLIASGAWDTFKSVLELITGHSRDASKGIGGIASAVNSLSKHKALLKSFGVALVSAFAVSKLTEFVIGLKKVSSTLGITSLLFTEKLKDGTKVVKLFSKETLAGKAVMLAWNGVTKLVAAGQKVLNLVMEANPIGLVIAAIGALIVVAVELYKHCKPFRDFVNGLGKDIKNVFSGIVNFAKGVADKFKSLGKDLKKIGGDYTNGLKDELRIFTDIFTGKFGNLKKDVPKLFSDMWKMIKDIGKAAFDFLNKLTGGKLGEMADTFKNVFSDIRKIWEDSWNGIGHFFEGIWDWIKKIVADGINNVIGVINDGIGGIDWVISKFGGSDNAIGKISPVKFATGTGALHGARRPITSPTLAMLNDGNDSPETNNREMVLHANGSSELVKGRNTLRMLEPNAEVLSASETRELMSMMPHFAKGTGFFGNLWNGVKSAASSAYDWTASTINSVKDKLSLIMKIIKNPGGFLTSEFKNPNGIQGVIEKSLGNGLFGQATGAVSGWWHELINMIKGSLDDGSGSASGLLGAVEKYGRGKRYVWGAHGPDAFDCSGLVAYALKTAFGIDLPQPSGSQIANTERISADQAQPGDLIGNSGHIGVYAGNGKYWAAASPESSPNIGMWPVSAFPDGPYKFGRVRGLAQKTKSPKHADENHLSRLINSETGGMLKWIQKHLAPLLNLGSGSDGNSPQGKMSKASFDSVARRAADITHNTLSGNDLAKLYWQAFDESGVNPATGGGINDNDGTGLPYGMFQFKKGTWDNYAVTGHSNMFSALDQLIAVLNDRNWRSDIAPEGVGVRSGWSPSGGRKLAVGGHLHAGEVAQVNEHGFEFFKPDVSGQVIPHHQAERIVNGDRHDKVEIKMGDVHVHGDADKNSIDKISRVLNSQTQELIEKMDRQTGRNIDGDVII